MAHYNLRRLLWNTAELYGQSDNHQISYILVNSFTLRFSTYSYWIYLFDCTDLGRNKTNSRVIFNTINSPNVCPFNWNRFEFECEWKQKTYHFSKKELLSLFLGVYLWIYSKKNCQNEAIGQLDKLSERQLSV